MKTYIKISRHILLGRLDQCNLFLITAPFEELDKMSLYFSFDFRKTDHKLCNHFLIMLRK